MNRSLTGKSNKPNGAFEALRANSADVVLRFYDAEKITELLAASVA
jgi:hypothetical protein